MSMPQPAPRRVVAAVTGDLQPRIRAIFPECDVRFVRSGTELVRVLDEARCEMMVVQVHFNESSAAAALMCVLAREESFPVVCVRDVPDAKPAYAALNALRMALGGIAARAFIDLVEHRDDEAGNAHVRSVLERLCAA
jgi:hypothetical protein